MTRLNITNTGVLIFIQYKIFLNLSFIIAIAVTV